MRENVKVDLDEFMKVSESLNSLMERFVDHGKGSSDTFAYWENYVADFSQLLVDYIAAKRDDNKGMELETFAEMLPLGFVCGHINYARWGTVNVAEQRLLQEDKLEIYQALASGHGFVY